MGAKQHFKFRHAVYKLAVHISWRNRSVQVVNSESCEAKVDLKANNYIYGVIKKQLTILMNYLIKYRAIKLCVLVKPTPIGKKVRNEGSEAICTTSPSTKSPTPSPAPLPSAMTFQRLHINMRQYNTGGVHERDQHRADAGRPRTRDEFI
ncbi:hypothetical protein PYW07_000534 [Mythimna separata]|uniref:Uncharacterized protein n=1 Tax=Mythimna separata TaxID=271217 RepID=A0AAD7Z461_MYTSE|nr:hypothetical protein PYW07_000534 [Mythimna separata]